MVWGGCGSCRHSLASACGGRGGGGGAGGGGGGTDDNSRGDVGRKTSEKTL